jgi:hypothetical protein
MQGLGLQHSFAVATSEIVLRNPGGASMGDRLAVLVIHGMGTQKPYETLDQFACALERLLNPSAHPKFYIRTLEYREHPTDPALQQKHWTQAIVRFRSLQPDHAKQPALIDLVEYYWAPIINGRVKALQSLQFLIRAALTPFDYLRENLVAIAQVSGDQTEKTTARAEQEGLPASSNGAILQILIREITRSAFIFFPMLLLLAGIYSLVAQPLLDTLAPKHQGDWVSYFWSGQPSWVSAIEVALSALRWLLLAMTGKFLINALFRSDNAPPELGKLLRRCNLFVALLFFALIALPFVDPIWRLVPWVFHWTAAAVATHAEQLRQDRQQQLVAVLRWLHLRIAFAPLALRLLHVLGYLALAMLTYLINRFLTTAIGDLAVYLGADTLSTNFAARSQIMEECTKTVRGLLDSQFDLLPDHTPSSYDRVILAAHSLGSVIAYDTLNDLMAQNVASSTPDQTLNRIAALFTFGCPLNKVFYFFRARTSPKTYVLNEILYALHNFRLRNPPPVGAHPSPEPFHPNFRWLNAWCPMDVISGRMLFYHADQNRIIKQGFEPATAHTGYWNNPKLYAFFAELLETRVNTEKAINAG